MFGVFLFCGSVCSRGSRTTTRREHPGLSRPARSAHRHCGLRNVAHARQTRSTLLRSRREQHALADHRAFRHGHPGQCGNVSLHAGAGIRKRTRFCPKLFRRPAGPDHHRHRLPAYLSTAECLHGLRIPRETVRFKNPFARRRSFSNSTWIGCGSHHLCAGDCALDRHGLAPRCHDHLQRTARCRLHCFRGKPGGESHPEISDRRDFRRHDRRIFRFAPAKLPADLRFDRRPHGRRRIPQAGWGGFLT